MSHSEEIANNVGQYGEVGRQEADETHYSLHTCRQAGDPLLITVERSLYVDLSHQPEEKAKICLGHKEDDMVRNNGSFAESTKELRKRYENDPSIDPDSIRIRCTATPLSGFYTARVTWKHKPNAEGCDRCKTKVVKEEVYQEISEEWIEDRPDLWALAQNPDSTIIEHVCIDKTASKCKRERLSFLYRFPKTKECDHLKTHLCEQIEQKCLEQTPFGCSVWEFTFKCFDGVKSGVVQVDPEDLFGFKEYSNQEEVQPNRSFAEVAAKLAVFDEAKKELEKSDTLDASSLEIGV